MTNFRSAGFTLIEVLVVLVIVAAMAGLLVFSFNDNPERELRREAAGLAALLNTAADEAVMRSRELGLVIDDRGYGFVEFDAQRRAWQPVLRKPLGEHRFEPGYRVEIALEGDDLDDATRARIAALAAGGDPNTEANLQAGASAKPALLLLSSGEVTPFTLTLHQGDAAVTLRSDGFNPVQLDDPSDAVAAGTGG